jgi:Spy/CpxP family protein refolding chaperone
LPRWLWIVLVGSLALNLLVAGVVASSFWRFHDRDGRGGGLGRSLVTYVKQLDRAKYDDIRRAFGTHRDSVRPLRRQVREARRELRALLVAETFDREKFRAAQDKLLAAQQTLRKSLRDSMVDIIANLSLAERKALLSWHEQRRRDRRHRRARRRHLDDANSSKQD